MKSIVAFIVTAITSSAATYLHPNGAHHFPHIPAVEHHHIPSTANIVSSRSYSATSTGSGPPSGYSASTYSQTVSAPTQVHSSFSTHHPAGAQGGQGQSSGQGQQMSGRGQDGGQGRGFSNQNFAYSYAHHNHQGGQGYGGQNQGGSGVPSFTPEGRSYGTQGQGNQGVRVGQGNQGQYYSGQGQGGQSNQAGGQRQGPNGYASFSGIASGHHYQYRYQHQGTNRN